MKKTVLLIAPPKSIHTRKHIDMLQAYDYHVVYIALRDEWRPIEDTYFVPLKYDFSFKLSLINAFFDINAIIKKVRPGIIHAHYLTPYGYFILPAKCTTIISLWGSDIRLKYSQSSGLFRRFLNKVMNKADILMIPGDYMLDYLDFSRKNIIETIWGIDTEHIGVKNDQEKNLWHFHNDEYIITSIRVNRDIFQIERIIDAVDRIRESGQKVKLNLIEGPYTEYNKIIRNKCTDKEFVQIHNHLLHDEYVSLLRATDIAVSIALEDAGPVSVKEAMAAGVPVVYQDIEGINRTIDSSTGFPLSTLSKDELVDVINTVINNTRKREKITRTAREVAISSFSQKTYISRVMGIYERLT